MPKPISQGRPSRRPLAVAIALGIGLALGLWIFTRGGENPTLRDARSARIALEAGDGHALFAYLWPKEVAELSLTPEKVDAFLKNIFLPRLRRMRPKGEPFDWVGGGGGQGVSAREYSDDLGRTLTVGAFAFKTELGGKILLSKLIMESWGLEFYRPSGSHITRKDLHEIKLRGLDADQARLESIGIHGWIDWPPQDRLETWDTLRERCLRGIREEQTKLNAQAAGRR